MQDFGHLKSVLSTFAEDEPSRAVLYRGRAGEDLATTGASVLVGQTDGRRFIEIRDLMGELPANIRIDDDGIWGSSQEEPDNWRALDDDDIDALRAFTLLDPRIFAEHLDDAEFRPGQNGETVVVVHVDLGSLPGLPGEYVEFLKADALDHEVELRFYGDTLLEISQQDLYPRHSDRIAERFEAARDALRTGPSAS